MRERPGFLLLFFSQYGEQLVKVWSTFSDMPWYRYVEISWNDPIWRNRILRITPEMGLEPVIGNPVWK